MTLKFKRNYPIILLLVAILAFLAFTLGDQGIIAYSLQVGDQQIELVAGTSLDTTTGIDLPDNWNEGELQ